MYHVDRGHNYDMTIVYKMPLNQKPLNRIGIGGGGGREGGQPVYDSTFNAFKRITCNNSIILV